MVLCTMVLCCGLLLFIIFLRSQKITTNVSSIPASAQEPEKPIESLSEKFPMAFVFPPSQRVTLAKSTTLTVDGSLSASSEESLTIKSYEWKILKAPEVSGFRSGQIVSHLPKWNLQKLRPRHIGEWRLQLTITDSKNRSSTTEAEIFIHDRIDSLVQPVRIPATEAKLPPDELMVGVSVKGESVAYPASIMDRHAIANDIVGEIPLYVTMCQSCDASAVFKRTLDDGKTITLQGTGGSLIESNYNFPDKETGTIWNVVSGEAIEGSNKGKVLEWLPDEFGFLGSWKEWLILHPDTLVITD